MYQLANYAVSFPQFCPSLYYVFAFVLAFLLYAFRSKQQTIYGALEILVGFFLVYFSEQISGPDFSPRDFSADFSISVRTTVTLTTYLGAIFAMVRGFDNIKHGWPLFTATCLARFSKKTCAPE